MTSRWIATFAQTAALETVGGKGLNLMRLTKAGRPAGAWQHCGKEGGHPCRDGYRRCVYPFLTESPISWTIRR